MELEVVERGPRERESALGEARPDPSGEESRPGPNWPEQPSELLYRVLAVRARHH
jgi:hypothetical protein